MSGKKKILAGQLELGSSPHQTESDLKTFFSSVRNHFAANVTGITRDEKIAENVMRLLFVKLHCEIAGGAQDEFRNLLVGGVAEVAEKFDDFFERVKADNPDIFELEEKIEISGSDLGWIASRLANFNLLSSSRDVIGEAFEELIGTAFRGGEGQFFTPRNVVELMVKYLDPRSGEKIIDPACGSGGFLASASIYLGEADQSDYQLVGIDKDDFLARIARTYLRFLDPNNSTVYCRNSLADPLGWGPTADQEDFLGSFDVVLTNPPFGAKIPVTGKGLLSQFELAYEWSSDAGSWTRTERLRDKQPPQILFIERCVQLLKDGGRMGIVLPDGIFGNPSDRYIWEYLDQHCRIDAVVSLSQEAFQPSTHTKTSILFVTKTKATSSVPVLMATADKVGHNKNGKLTFKIDAYGAQLKDKNGNPIPDDELGDVLEELIRLRKNPRGRSSRLGFSVKRSNIKDKIYIPGFYDPQVQNLKAKISKGGETDFIRIGDLVANKKLAISRGREIGSHFYGSGDIPFVRTSDIVNWEIKADPVKGVSEEVYEMYEKSMDIQPGDVLFVNDGTFLIGRTALVTENNSKFLLQSHVKKIRSLDSSLSPYYLLYLLNTEFVLEQVKAKTFVQATISTIGNRLLEIELPYAKDSEQRGAIESEVEAIICGKDLLAQRAKALFAR